MTALRPPRRPSWLLLIAVVAGVLALLVWWFEL